MQEDMTPADRELERALRSIPPTAARLNPAAAAFAPTEGAVLASATSGTRPRKYAAPLSPRAINDTRAGSSVRRSPGAFATGSQTNVIFVLPSAPRSDPIHVRTTRARDGAVMAAIAVSTALGGSALGGASALAASAAVYAQYPLRART